MVNIVTWNVNKEQELVEVMEKGKNIEYLGITETKRKGTGCKEYIKNTG